MLLTCPLLCQIACPLLCQVRALVRQRDAGSAAAAAAGSSSTDGSGEEAIPQAVEQVAGDLGDYAACRAAVKGVDKVGVR